MTTIAYRDGVLAADTLSTWGNTRDGSTTKIARRAGILAAASGCQAKMHAFLDWFGKGAVGDPPDMGEGELAATGVLILHDDTILTYDRSGWARTRSPTVAMGSGGEFAQGAMSAGASAEAAVAAAIEHDVKSGGEIMVLRR